MQCENAYELSKGMDPLCPNNPRGGIGKCVIENRLVQSLDPVCGPSFDMCAAGVHLFGRNDGNDRD